MTSRRPGGALPANHHIHRVDTEERGRHAWMVMIQRNGRRVTRIFYDAAHEGGRKAALAAARVWRDSVLDGAPADDRATHLRLVVRRNSKSGLPGVIRYEPKKEKRGPCWIASWEEPDVGQRKKRFSIRLYGEAGAKARAVEARRAALERLGFIGEGAPLTRAPVTPGDEAGRRQPEIVPPHKRAAPEDAIAALSRKPRRPKPSRPRR